MYFNVDNYCLNDLVLSLICLFIFFVRLVLIGFNIFIFLGLGEI